jgi:MFS family permease
MIDRFGPRPMMLAGVILSGLGYILLAGVETYAGFLVVYLGVISLSFSAGFMHSPMVLANSWFIRRKAFAMTLISSSIGIGGMVITPLLAFSVQNWGWRYGALLSGLGLIIVGIPIATLAKRSPESMGLLPDGAAPEAEKPTISSNISSRADQIPANAPDFTVWQAMRMRAFWMLVLATTARVGVFNSITVHFVPLMVWKGATEQHAAAMLAVMAFMSLPSHLFIGWIADRVSKPRLMALCMVVGAIAIAFLAYGDDLVSLWIFTLLITFVEAIFPVSWATVGDFFGRRSFATIRGTMSFFYLWGPALGPVIAGAVYDRHQSYAPLMAAFIVTFLISAVLYALLRRPVPR